MLACISRHQVAHLPVKLTLWSLMGDAANLKCQHLTMTLSMQVNAPSQQT